MDRDTNLSSIIRQYMEQVAAQNAAAERGGCGRIWSEDFNPGQKYFGVAVENPFA